MKKNYKLKKPIKRALWVLFFVFTVYTCTSLYFTFANTSKTISIERGEVLSYNVSQLNDVVYLSDIPYQKAQIGWGTLGLDKTNSNTPLVLRINNASVTVKKGIWAHATSTMEYDISDYKDYAYFITYYGLNTTSTGGNGVKFYIYTSKDGNDWTLRTEENPNALMGSSNAQYAKIDIRDANYIRLYAFDNGSNGQDHAVWGDAKLVKEDYSENVMMPVEEFDQIIKDNYKSGPVTGDLKLVVLQRNFIKNVGQYQLRSFLEANQKNYETLNWFINNEEALRLWTVGGRPNGTYERSLQVLSDLYHTYKEDLSNENQTSQGNKYKDVYLKMMLALSLTHSSNIGLWIGGNQLSDAVVRYDIYKQMHLNHQLASDSMFESYTIDEMRGVMSNNIDDEEIMWLHNYSSKKEENERFNPFKYINYTFNYGYYRPQYYSQANYAKWDEKYELSKYNITYRSGKPKLWIVFEEGSVCGGLSKTAANLYGVWGTPSYVVGQPGHAAYIYLKNAGGGKLAWQLSYNVAATAWAATDGRAVNGWGSRYSTGVIKTGSYRLLAQEAQNEYDKYERAQLILMLEDVYKNDRKKLEKIYLDALKEEEINLDAWIGLINLYITDDSKKESDLIDLAKDVAKVYAYHPLPMYDMVTRIGTKVTSPEYKTQLMMLKDKTLRNAVKATASDTIYSNEVSVIANAILGVVDNRVATFSFDGTNAGKIVLSKQFQSAQVTWRYSLDGGNKWTQVYEHSTQLSDEELSLVNATDDIKIHINGLPLTDANIYTIDINKGVFPTHLISVDDLENRLSGTNDQMEWTLDPTSSEWTSFSEGSPNLKGDVVVYLRLKASGTNTTSDPVHYTYTMNASSLTNRYISRSNLEAVSASSTGKGDVKNILDGNTTTTWRSKPGAVFSGTYPVSNVVVKIVDKPRYVSEIDYTPEANAIVVGTYISGHAKKINVYVSLDGTNWELAVSQNNIVKSNGAKKITFPEAKLAQYVKIECTEVYDMQPYENFFSISVINLYENPSASETPTAEVSYNITGRTNKNVIAELVDENRPITVTNNDGKKTHTFTENGEFIFEFKDSNGLKGTATATVNWIDKSVPTVEVSFSKTELTNEDVVATLSFDKEVTILSNDVQIAENPVDKSKTITFAQNEIVLLEFQDDLGNIGKETITVDWIDKEAPTAEFEYSTTTLTDGSVEVTLVPSEEVTVTNNNGKFTHVFTENGEFTFEFIDKAGNEGRATSIVNWIARLPKYEIVYSITEPTNKDVVATLKLEEGYRIFNNNAKNEYTFTESKVFEFQYMDQNGNLGVIPVKVDWIDKEAPTAEFNYNTQNWTNGEVEVTLIPNEEVTVTNNDGKFTHVFTENGDFTFEFADKVGNVGSKTVSVKWIDKEAPTGTIEYSTEDETEEPVTATLHASEEVTVTNNDGKFTHVFTENGEFTFEFIDRAGNKGTVTVSVSWITKKDNSGEPDLPEGPEEKPEEPEKPETPEKPEEKPEDKPSIGEGDNQNENTPSPTVPADKPSNGNTTTTKPSSNKPIKVTTVKTTTTKKVSDDSKGNYQEVSNGTAHIKIPDSILSKYDDVSIESNKLVISEDLKDRNGDDSELYELSLKSNNNEKIDLSNEKIEQSIKLSSNKALDAVYLVMEDGNLVKLSTKINSNNEAVFESTGLGKYLVVYKTENTSGEGENNVIKIDKKEDKNNYIIYIVSAVLGLIFITFVGYFIVKKKTRKIY